MSDALRDTLLMGRYRVLVPIAKGGMGAVYEALDERTNQRVAVKLIRSEFLKDVVSIERFKREATMSSQLRHPSIVATLDVSLESDPPFFVMELLDGPTVSELLSLADRLPWARAIGVARDVLEGLVALHAVGAIHRDIKPSNVMLVREGERERAKIIDLGVIRVAPETGEESLTWSGNVVGTPSFMAPEQYAGEVIDERSDLYSVGILCAKMLRGTHGVLRVPLAGPATLDPWPTDVPAALARFVESLLRERAVDRPSSAIVALDALSAIERASLESPARVAPSPTDSSYGGALSADAPRAVGARLYVASSGSVANNATVLSSATPNTVTLPTQSVSSLAPVVAKPQRARKRWPWVVAAVVLSSAVTASVAVTIATREEPETEQERGYATTAQIAAPNVMRVQTPTGERYEPMGTRLRFIYAVPDGVNLRNTMMQTVELPIKRCIDPAQHPLGRSVVDVVIQVDASGTTTHINSTANQTTAEEDACVIPILRNARWPAAPAPHEIRLTAHTDL
ncbi:MAG: serine/threonine-protein kinase [Polyangiales bacterium]